MAERTKRKIAGFGVATLLGAILGVTHASYWLIALVGLFLMAVVTPWSLLAPDERQRDG